MRSIKIIILGCVLCSLLHATCRAQNPNSPLNIEILLNNRLLSDVGINGALIPSFEFTAGRQAIIASQSQLYLLGLGNIINFGKTSAAIESFALTPDSMLMVVKRNELCLMDSSGSLTSLLKLPSDGMGLSSGKYVMYIYERNPAGVSSSIYILEPGGRYIKLLELPGPVYGAEEKDNSLVFTNGTALFELNLSTKNMKVLAVLQGNDPLISVASDPGSGRIYFSTLREVYSVKGDTLVKVTGELGGSLKYNEGLVIFDNQGKSMVRLAAADNMLVSVAEKKVNEPVKTVYVEPEKVVYATNPVSKGAERNILGNSDIIEFVRSGFSVALIKNIISNSDVNFDLSVPGMITLSEAGVPSDIIMEMRNAQNKNEQ